MRFVPGRPVVRELSFKQAREPKSLFDWVCVLSMTPFRRTAAPRAAGACRLTLLLRPAWMTATATCVMPPTDGSRQNPCDSAGTVRAD